MSLFLFVAVAVADANLIYLDLCAALCQEKICRHIGKNVLASFGEGAEISVTEFMDRWRAKIPESFECTLGLVKDYVLSWVNESGADMMLYLAREKLPSSLPDRLRLLFEVRERWLRSDLIHWVRDLAPGCSEKTAEQLLMRSARMVRAGGQVYFFARNDMSSLR